MNMAVRKGLWGLMLRTNAAFRTYQRTVKPAPVAPPAPSPPAPSTPPSSKQQEEAAGGMRADELGGKGGQQRRGGWRSAAWGLLSSAASKAKGLVQEACDAAVAAGRLVARAHSALWAFATNAQWAVVSRLAGLYRPLLGQGQAGAKGGHELNARNLRYLQALQQQQQLQLTPVYNWPAPQQQQQQQQQQRGGARADSVASSRPSSRSGARPAGNSELLMWVPNGG
jgi:hypothetical protein